MGKVKVTAFDQYVGERIREARLGIKMSQKDLGDLLGVSFQQIQKYETGANRVSGARFELLVTALRRPLTYFFPNGTDIRATADPLFSAMMATKDGQAILQVFSRIASPPDRRLVIQFAERLAREQAR